MNTLVIYDSQFGNTERLAELIAETFQAYGPARAVHVDPEQTIVLDGIDLFILGCLTQAFNSTVAMQSVIKTISQTTLRTVAVACFDTKMRGPWGSAARSMAKHLRDKGIELLLPPQSFIVTGREGPLADNEEEHAVTWAKVLQEKLAIQMALVG